MADRQTLEMMGRLLRLNVAGMALYEHAASKVGDQDVKAQFEAFRDEHRRHANDIQAWLHSSAEQPISPTDEFQELARLRVEAVREAGSQDELLRMVHLAELAEASEYAETLQGAVPDDARQVLEDHLRAEHAHLDAVEQASPLSASNIAAAGGWSAAKPDGGVGGV